MTIVLIYRLMHIETPILISSLNLVKKYQFMYRLNPRLRLWLLVTPPSWDPVTS